VLRAMARDPAARFDSAAELARALEKVQPERFGAADLATLVVREERSSWPEPSGVERLTVRARPTVPERPPSRPRRAPRVAAMVLGGLALAALAIVMWPRRSEAPLPPATAVAPAAAVAPPPAAAPALPRG